MRLIKTSNPNWVDSLTKKQADYAYNALDCCVTAEVHDVLDARHTENSRRIYAFERACQLPAFTMQVRGVRVDEEARQAGMALVEAEGKALQGTVDEHAATHGSDPFKYGVSLSIFLFALSSADQSSSGQKS